MLTYKVKLEADNFKKDRLVWSEKFVAPDLSFVSGVTSQDYHIETDGFISASIGNSSNFSKLKVTCKNVTRNGYVLIKGKEYKVKTAKKSVASGGTFSYVDVGGVFYYIKTGESKITIKNWLQEKWSNIDGEYKAEIIEGDYTATVDLVNNIAKIDTIAWIEDEKVSIDGNLYLFDPYDISEYSSSVGGLRYYEDGRCLTPSEVTACDTLVYNHYKDASEYKYVTKFVLRKTEDETYEYDRLTYCSYFFYAYYNENYCPVRRVEDNEHNVKYVCEVPDSDNSIQQLDVILPNGDSYPKRISQLKNYDAYVTINGTNVNIEYTVQNSNSGDEIIVYLSDDTHNIGLGENLTFLYDNGYENSLPVYTLNGVDFVMHDNVKYVVQKNIADAVNINGYYYDVFYPYGKTVGNDALVDVDGETIPMKIKSDNELERYGLIVSSSTYVADAMSASSSITEAVYEIKGYDGVVIDDTVYRVLNLDSTPRTKCILFDKPMIGEFSVVSTEGSSMLICAPNLNTTEYDEDFIDKMSPLICGRFVGVNDKIKIYSKNKAFGSRIITPEVGLVTDDGADSSLDYDNILDKLVLFTNDSYIQFRLPLTFNVTNNAMQEDIVERDFYEAEKEKAINSIVDMEKDVYMPMHMSGKTYEGSTTTFYPVSDIEVNLHFRTRNLDNWKVNEGNTNVEISGASDNWFCTDFYPYKQLISSSTSNAKAVMNSSDLMGLLMFDNDDVFYQKSSISKSFLRFSYYDSPDPNTQSLLCTSTVFMDEHSLYKKYLDNSRRNIKDYGIVQPQEYKTSATTDGTEYVIIPQTIVNGFKGDSINRISVFTELLKGSHNPSRKSYDEGDLDIADLYNDEKRISSRFKITNKFNTDTSSEGFYLYMFREYSENLHPKPIYMKIEFNHAGIGRTIPFIVPMKWSTGATDNDEYPVSALTLSGGDLDDLKEGYPLSYVYAQTYIPLYAVYDFNNKKYAYVFDDRYIDTDLLYKENKVRLNLFEIKVKDEYTATNKSRAQVRNNNIQRANINVNTNQFSENI